MQNISNCAETFKISKEQKWQIFLVLTRHWSNHPLAPLDQRGVTTKSDKFFFVTYPQTNIGLRKKWKNFFFATYPIKTPPTPSGSPRQESLVVRGSPWTSNTPQLPSPQYSQKNIIHPWIPEVSKSKFAYQQKFR